MKYVLYDSTGEIRMWGEADSPPSNASGLTELEADGSPFTHYVKNGVLVSYTTGQLASKAVVPTYPATWSNTLFTWVDNRDLATAKADTWNAVRTARDANLAAGFMWNGHKFDSDDVSIQRIQGAVTLAQLAMGAGQGFSIVWTLFDNSTLTLSGSDMISVYLALGSFTQSLFSAGVTLRQQIDVSTATSQLNNITWANIS